MSETSLTMRLYLVTLAFAGVAFLAVSDAQAITFGEPDCIDNATNTGCLHPNTVSLCGFSGGVSAFRCSGTLLTENADRIVILTAGHCASGWISGNQVGFGLGVSFDAEIVRDRPRPDRPWNWSRRQYLMGGRPVLPAGYGPIS